MILEQLFDDYCKKVSAKDSKSLDLVALKNEHRRLCDVVVLASKMFLPLRLVLMALYIPLICFAFYITVNPPSQMVDGSYAGTSELLAVYWLLVSAASAAFILTFGSKVNDKASA